MLYVCLLIERNFLKYGLPWLFIRTLPTSSIRVFSFLFLSGALKALLVDKRPYDVLAVGRLRCEGQEKEVADCNWTSPRHCNEDRIAAVECKENKGSKFTNNSQNLKVFISYWIYFLNTYIRVILVHVWFNSTQVAQNIGLREELAAIKSNLTQSLEENLLPTSARHVEVISLP